MASPALKKAPSRKSVDARISGEDRVRLYALGRAVPSDLRDAATHIPLVTYFQDPFVAKLNADLAFDKSSLTPWEPGLDDGPTSARFAVVDFNGDTGKLEPPARWDLETERFLNRDGLPLDETLKDDPAFHQVNVWALLQQSLALFEEALGRRIPWGFEGNRLIVVPHAGYGENAFYDRQSKSLQFYYYGDSEKPGFTCLSTDIVCHEFGHAVLDGVRPLLHESPSVETAAFHEFFGDLCALVMTMHNNSLRRREADKTLGNLSEAKTFTDLAEDFGQQIQGRPYLRSFRNEFTMGKMAGQTSHHALSQVLSGAMYDLLIALGDSYANPKSGRKGLTPRRSYWEAANRILRMGHQSLDLLPPVEVTFRDYARAVCRAQQLADPLDPERYLQMAIKAFVKRGILSGDDEKELLDPQYLYRRLDLNVSFNIDDISRSRAAAYRFLDDNRQELLIPTGRDFFVADLYDARKRGRENLALPRQVVVQYVWREEVLLEGARFGKFNGQRTSMLCGGTLVFDDRGTPLSWTIKPGSTPYAGKRERGGEIAKLWQKAVAEGEKRREKFLDDIAAQIAAGNIGSLTGSAKGLLGTMVPPVLAETGSDGAVRFQLAPHMHLNEKHQPAEDNLGERQWQISS